MKHLYDNEIAPTQSRVMELESSLAETKREIAALQKEVDDLRADVNTARHAEAPGPAPATAADSMPPRDPLYALDQSDSMDAYGGNTATDINADEPYSTSAANAAITDDLFVLHLASYGSTEAAKRGWTMLSGDYPAELTGLTPWTTTITKSDTAETFHRLLAGPLTSREDADRICAELAAEGAYCKVMPFAGDPLMMEQ